MSIYKKLLVEIVAYDEQDVITTSGIPEVPFQGGEVGGNWKWDIDGAWSEIGGGN